MTRFNTWFKGVASLFAVVALAGASACSTEGSSLDEETVSETTSTLTTTEQGAVTTSAPTGTENSGSPETSSATESYLRISPSTYDIGIPDAESAVFSTGDGTSALCSFMATPGQFDFQQRMFEFDETVGGCTFESGSEYVSINTDENARNKFVELQDNPQEEIPDPPATLDEGEIVHLGHMGCWAPTASSLGCMKYESGEAFMIDANGYREVDDKEVMKQLTNSTGQTQVLSRIAEFNFGAVANPTPETGVRCYHDTVNDLQFSCANIDPSGWEASEGPSPANVVSWNLDNGGAQFNNAIAANPSMNLHESRQVLEPGLYLFDGGLSAEFDGSTVTFTTSNDDSFWVDGQEYGPM